MLSAILVFVGGGFGALLRYGVSRVGQACDWTYPWATWGVNMVGACVIGLLAGWAVQGQEWSPEMRAGVLVGVLGGLTTFSTYSLEVMQLFRAGDMGHALGYILLSNVVGLGLCWLGFRWAGA